MELNKRELEVLEFVLERKETLTRIATALKIKKSNLSGYVKKLGKYWLVTEWQEGRNKVIKAESPVWFGLSQIKGNFPLMKLTDILIGKTPFLLSFLKGKEQFKLTDLDLPPASAKRILKKLRNLGVLNMPKKGTYGVRKESEDVIDFAKNILLRAYAMEGKTKLDASPMRLIGSFNSCKYIEVIIECSNEKKIREYWPTAFSVFNRYDIHIILAGKFYYTNIKPSIADVIIHTLALSKDARNIMYVSALMLKNSFDPKKLLKKRQSFGLGKDFINNIIEFMETKGQKTFEGFPSWQEVEGVLNG